MRYEFNTDKQSLLVLVGSDRKHFTQHLYKSTTTNKKTTRLYKKKKQCKNKMQK